MEVSQFNIRVYGLLVDAGRILVTDEFRMGIFMTKFPGGGLNFGEGTIDSLRREFWEELNSEIEEITHFYTTDYFQPTTLLPSAMQLISIYYRVSVGKPYNFKTTSKKYNFPTITDSAQCFRWLDLNSLLEKDFTFPVDQRIIPRIRLELS